MDYHEFLSNLQVAGWSVPNKSFASKTFGQWQVAFVRMGGRFQVAGHITFVVCIRHTSLRDREKELREVVKEPFDFPFKLTTQDITTVTLQYSSHLLNFDKSTHSIDADWSENFALLNDAIPQKLLEYSAPQLRKEILQCGELGYLERIWVEDLA